MPQTTAKPRGRIPMVYIVDLPAERGRVHSHAWAPATARCTTSRHARPRGSRRPGRSLWVPSARPRPWWTLRLPFRSSLVLAGCKQGPQGLRIDFLHFSSIHRGCSASCGLSKHPCGRLRLVVKVLERLEGCLRNPFFGLPIFVHFFGKIRQ